MMKIALLLLLLGSVAAQDAISAIQKDFSELDEDIEKEFAELDALDELGGFVAAIEKEFAELDELDELGEYDEVVEIDLGLYQQPNNNLRGKKDRELVFVGQMRYCNFCGRRPTKNVGVAVLGMSGRHTCMSLYSKGQARRIPFNFCPIMRTALKYKCGCAGTGGGGNYNKNKWNANSGGSNNRYNRNSSNNKWKNGSAASSNNKWKNNNRSASSNTKWKNNNRSASTGGWRWKNNRFLRFLNFSD